MVKLSMNSMGRNAVKVQFPMSFISKCSATNRPVENKNCTGIKLDRKQYVSKFLLTRVHSSSRYTQAKFEFKRWTTELCHWKYQERTYQLHPDSREEGSNSFYTMNSSMNWKIIRSKLVLLDPKTIFLIQDYALINRGADNSNRKHEIWNLKSERKFVF